MAEIVGIYAASHTPVMINFPDAIPEQDQRDIYGSFREMGEMLIAGRPQAVVVVADDHLHNFFLDNLPAFCIGAAESYETPIEHWLKTEKRVLRGDAALSAYLAIAALEAGFDPAYSMQLTLDHGMLTPLELAGAADQVTVVPLLVNCVQPPLPTMRRCLQWGHFLGGALRAYDGVERVAILATGGISHDVATPRMGMVNEEFDRTFLDLLAGNDAEALIAHATDKVHLAGNGAEEIRNWLVAHGAAAGGPFETLFYRPMQAWYTGIGLGRWRV